MSNQTTKTNNSYFFDKVYLRKKYIPKNKNINVLDCFHGAGKIWNKLKTDKITILGIDKQHYTNSFCLIGDNIKYLKKINLKEYDIVDLDCYGTPCKQIEAIIENGTYKKGVIVFYTFIQSIFGMLPYIMLEKIGYPKEMVKKCKTLFAKNGFEKFKQYLLKCGVKETSYIEHKNKIYGVFVLNK